MLTAVCLRQPCSSSSSLVITPHLCTSCILSFLKWFLCNQYCNNCCKFYPYYTSVDEFIVQYFGCDYFTVRLSATNGWTDGDINENT